MNHSTVSELLPLYSLDALEAREAREVERHLARCRACRAELDSYSSVATALAGEIEPRPAVWEGILARIDLPGVFTPLSG